MRSSRRRRPPHGVAFLCCLVIETFYDRRRLRRHKVFGYLTPAETR
ncbi:hypothetical protein AB0899_23785 [Streptomyces sp. NPDC007002]